jgi:molybdopterin converting factor small subunit
MVEIRYGEQIEVTDLAGQTIGEARDHYKAAFGIPDKAKAKLNGSKVKSSAEIDTVLNDDDQVTFAVARSRTPFLIGALLLALAITGGVFAFGFTNANITLSATGDTDFVTVNATNETLGWDVWGLFKGSIFDEAKDLFYIKPATGWTGDLVVTVSLGNVGELAKKYRAFALELELYDTNNPITPLPLGLSQNQVVLLSLDYPSVNLFYGGSTTNMTVRVKSGYYVATHFPAGGTASPEIFCDVTQSDF